MQLHDTRLGHLVELVPRTPGRIEMYVCGPTVYGPPHLGHARTAIAFDLIRRWLHWQGYDVTFVSNYTDVDDKIIARAHEEGRSPGDVARTYEALWADTMRRLRIDDPDQTPRATEAIEAMVGMVELLIKRDHAYVADGDVYFDVSSCPDYGALSHQPMDALQTGARIEPGEHKRSPEDFALWKAAKPGEPSWPSPWGPGRPGWHIECSVMAVGAFGMGFDIHGGGSDLIFPHHENEIAQAQCAYGTTPFARYWLHSGMVNLRGEKMAKSTGNFVELLDLMGEHSAEAIRLLVAQTHYRHTLEFTPELVEECERAVDRLGTFRDRLADVLDMDPAAIATSGGVMLAEPDPVAIAALRQAMDDDFHTPGASAALFEMVRRANAALDDGESSCASQWAAALAVFDDTLGVIPQPSSTPSGEAEDVLIAGLVELALDLRRQSREVQDFNTADQIRTRLGELGIIAEDMPEGTRWRRSRR